MKKIFLLLTLLLTINCFSQSLKVAINPNSVVIRTGSSVTYNLNNISSFTVDYTNKVVNINYSNLIYKLEYNNIASISVSNGSYVSPTTFEDLITQLSTLITTSSGGGGGGSGDASAANQVISNTKLTNIETKLNGTLAVNVGLTDSQLRATSVPVSGTFYQATQPISAASLPIPTGASTSALQTTGNANILSIDTKTPALVSGRSPVDGSGVTQPISATTLPLPSGASTGANQTTGNNSLASIDSKFNTLGQKTNSNSVPVTIASDNTVDVRFAGSKFFFSTLNSSSSQLAPAATYTGTVEDITGYPSASVLVFSDQNGTLTINQYIDAAGTKLVNSQVFGYTANGAFSRSFTLNGNYIKCVFQNNGGSTTTTFQLDTAYGVIDSATQLSNYPIALNEVSGTAFTLGSKAASTSIPTTLSIENTSGTITTQNLVPAGNATANSAVEITLNGAAGAAIQTTGTYTGALSLQVTADGSNWITVGGSPFKNMNTGGALTTITSALQSTFQAEVGGFLKARITGLAAMTGTATVSIRAIANTPLIGIDTPLPTGTNTIGTINIAAAQTLGTVTTLSNGQTAHSSAATGSPLRAAGRVVPVSAATQDLTLSSGDASEIGMTTSQQLINKPFSTAELDYTYNISSPVTTTTLQPLVLASGTASVRNYITSLTLQSDALGAAGNAWIVDGQGAIGISVTIATPGVFTSSTHDLKIGDAIIFTSLGTITGISTNTIYYVTATSFTGVTFTVATTLGGTAVTITGSTSAFTFYRVLCPLRLQTPALATPAIFTFPTPLRGMANTACNLLIPTSLTSGSIYLSVNGYRGF